MESKEKMMTVLQAYRDLKDFPDFPRYFPFSLFDEQYAMKFHGQTLTRLAERGGLSVVEIYYHIRREKFPITGYVSKDTAIDYLKTLKPTTNEQ